MFLYLLLYVAVTGVLQTGLHRLGFNEAANVVYVIHLMGVVPMRVSRCRSASGRTSPTGGWRSTSDACRCTPRSRRPRRRGPPQSRGTDRAYGEEEDGMSKMVIGLADGLQKLLVTSTLTGRASLWTLEWDIYLLLGGESPSVRTWPTPTGRKLAEEMQAGHRRSNRARPDRQPAASCARTATSTPPAAAPPAGLGRRGAGRFRRRCDDIVGVGSYLMDCEEADVVQALLRVGIRRSAPRGPTRDGSAITRARREGPANVLHRSRAASVPRAVRSMPSRNSDSVTTSFLMTRRAAAGRRRRSPGCRLRPRPS